MGAGDKINRWWLVLVLGPMALFLTMVGLSIGGALAASDAALEASRLADKVAADLSVHEARQNGALESIKSQLGTLRTYHSTLRGEMKEQRLLLDELLRKSHTNHPGPTP